LCGTPRTSSPTREGLCVRVVGAGVPDSPIVENHTGRPEAVPYGGKVMCSNGRGGCQENNPSGASRQLPLHKGAFWVGMV